MSEFGFILRRLALTGHGRKTADIEFKRGLNVICGPSNTGKTLIAKCIDFMFGGKDNPLDSIPQADGYHEVQLDIEAATGEVMSLSRSLAGGLFKLKRAGGQVESLKARHGENKTDSLSYFLLSLTGLNNKYIRENAQGRTKSLSFRRISRLVIVGEEDVIAERSPVLSGQHTDKVTETSLFRVMLTGSDDSWLRLEYKDPHENNKQGQKQLLKELLAVNEREIAESIDGDIKGQVDEKEVEGSLKAVEMVVQEVPKVLSAERESATALEEKRKAAWSSLRKVQSRVAVLEGLQHRFELLEKQYDSDLLRLEAIGKAGKRLAQMPEECCPVCGAMAEHHDTEHQYKHTHPENVAAACIAERQKIRVLRRDLTVALKENRTQLERLKAEETKCEMRLKETQNRLRKEVEPRLSELVTSFDEAEQRRIHLVRLSLLLSRRRELEELLDEAEKPTPKGPKLPSTSVSADDAEDFCKTVKELLRAWNFPNLDSVAFDEKAQDLMINQQDRSTQGKGVRALTHAAFSLALLRYCVGHDMPHPGLVVVDSPLVVYREPDLLESGEEYRVKDAFYRSIATTFASEQVIVIENVAPPEDLEGAHIITFTGTNMGRTGFFLL